MFLTACSWGSLLEGEKGEHLCWSYPWSWTLLLGGSALVTSSDGALRGAEGVWLLCGGPYLFLATTIYIYIYIYIYICVCVYIYIYIAAVVRMMQKVLPCDRIVSLIVSKTDYLQALGGVLNPHVATPTHKLQYTVGINPNSDCFYCLSTRFSCYASFNCDSFILTVWSVQILSCQTSAAAHRSFSLPAVVCGYNAQCNSHTSTLHISSHYWCIQLQQLWIHLKHQVLQ